MKLLPLLSLLPIIALAGCVTEQGAKSSAKAKPAPLFKTSAAYTGTSKVPDQSARPEALRVEIVPAEVRYHFADDAVAVQYSEKLNAFIEQEDMDLVDSILLVWPGVWSLISDEVGELPGPQLRCVVPSMSGDGSPIFLCGKFCTESPSIIAATVAVLKCVKSDGSWTIRALNPEEMAKWWAYIPFDIGEPTFLVQTEGGRYKFIFAFSSNGKISSIEELNSLPDFANDRMIPTEENRLKLERCSSK
ncbi:MAG: hypothetical protein WC360_02260 [Opitutales bacterium]|jgi:hypothetical protein